MSKVKVSGSKYVCTHGKFLSFFFLYPRMLCANFSWNWSNGYGDEGINFKYKVWIQRAIGQERTEKKCPWSFQLRWAVKLLEVQYWFTISPLSEMNRTLFAQTETKDFFNVWMKFLLIVLYLLVMALFSFSPFKQSGCPPSAYSRHAISKCT